jgi:hypothetical protein
MSFVKYLDDSIKKSDPMIKLLTCIAEAIKAVRPSCAIAAVALDWSGNPEQLRFALAENVLEMRGLAVWRGGEHDAESRTDSWR